MWGRVARGGDGGRLGGAGSGAVVTMGWEAAGGSILGAESASWEEKDVKGRKFQGSVGCGGAGSEGTAPPTFLSTACATELKVGLRLDIGKTVAKLLRELEMGR
jgi:hypothetical protein